MKLHYLFCNNKIFKKTASSTRSKITSINSFFPFFSVDKGDFQLKFSIRILHNLYDKEEEFEATGDFLVAIVYGCEENWENVKAIEDKILIHSIGKKYMT